MDGFTGSSEFQSKYGALDNPCFVTLLYRNVLDREPDAAGLQSWSSALNGGTPRSQVVLGFSGGTHGRIGPGGAAAGPLRAGRGGAQA